VVDHDLLRLAWQIEAHDQYASKTPVRTHKVMSLLFNRIEQYFADHAGSHLSTILNNIVEPESGVTILFIVDNCEQCGQHNHCI
jgi:hypothetical protein